MRSNDTVKDVKIRPARLEDASQVCDVHRSHVDRWYRILGSEMHEVGYGSLSIGERWGFGGPWMSTETCAIHLNNMLLQRHYPIVAYRGHRVTGEMELFESREGNSYD